jgi:hypothetical protein
MTTPSQPATPPKASGGGNVFTRKMGPLPMWAWMAIMLVLAGGYYLIKGKGSSSSTTGSTSASTVDTPGGVDSSLVPQFVNQTYVQGAPPAAPAATTSTSASPINEILQAGHTINPSAGNAQVGWTIAQKSPNATQLKVVINGPGKKNETRYVPASATTATFQDLSPGHTYDVAVTPIDAKGQAVGGPNNINLVTAKKLWLTWGTSARATPPWNSWWRPG